MALPKLNDSPKFELTVPSTQKSVRFRPYLVKEEKVLLMAFESGDETATLAAVLDTIVSCVQGDINPSTLTTFDVEYMFTQIRAKSVGEKTKVGVTCGECNTKNEVSINLEEVKVKIPDNKVSNKIAISDEITIEMGYPSYSNLTDGSHMLNGNSEGAFDLVASCMVAIETEEERIATRDEPKDSIKEFLESMTSSQFLMLAEYLKEMPKTTYELEFTCEHCGAENKRTIEGMQNFF